MDHTDHTNLLRDGIATPGGVWADFGAGTGAFTLALADLLGPGAEIVAIDRDASRLRDNEQAMRARFAETEASYVVADFTQALDLPTLDGIVIANALHSAPATLCEQTRLHGPASASARRGLGRARRSSSAQCCTPRRAAGPRH